MFARPSSVRNNLDKVTAIFVTLITLLLGTVFLGSSAAEEPATPFPMHRGINVAGPFVRVKPAPPNPDGQISDFWTLQKYPGWYTGEELRQSGFDFVRIPVNPAVLLENPPAVRARLLDELQDGILAYLSAGLRVIFDLHFWSPPNDIWTDKALTGGADAAAVNG